MKVIIRISDPETQWQVSVFNDDDGAVAFGLHFADKEAPNHVVRLSDAEWKFIKETFD